MDIIRELEIDCLFIVNNFLHLIIKRAAMKKIIIMISMPLILITETFAQNRAPIVTNVNTSQRSNTKFFDVTYGNGIRPKNRKFIVWDSGKEYLNQHGTKYQAKVVANDNKISVQVINDGYDDYVLVPGGEFKMGDNFNEGDFDEKPVHTVYLSVYYIGKYEVKNTEYKKFIEDRGYTTQSYWTSGGFGQYGSQPYCWINSQYRGGGISGNENFPVVGISWYEAMAYCNWLSAKTGKIFRLPTEAEWEKAARGDDTKNSTLRHQRRYPWGDNFDGSYANYWYSGDPYDNGLTPVGYYDGTTHGNFVTYNNASPYGAYDMTGNVWEWCSDWYSDNYYSRSHINNPTGTSSGSSRVIRGGSWYGLQLRPAHG